jgi:hypothetical protein
MRWWQRAAALIAVVIFTACAGGGGGARTSPAAMATARGTLSITLRIPQTTAATQSTKRRAQYISSATQSLRISLQTVNGQAPSPPVSDIVVSLVPPSCPVNGGYTTCTVSEPAVVGVDAYAFDLYASTDGSGQALATASSTVTVTQGVATMASVTFNGVDSGSLSLSSSLFTAPADGAKHTFNFTVAAADAAGKTITPPGNYTTPISLSISNDPNGALALSTTSISAPGTNGRTTVTITYDASKSLTDGQIVVADGGMTSTVSVAPLIYSPTSVKFFLGTSPATQTVVAGEATSSTQAYSVGLTGSFAQFVCVCRPVAGGQIAIQITSESVGRGTLIITDPFGATASVPVGVGGSAPVLMPTSITAQEYGIFSSASGYLFLGQGAKVGSIQPSSCSSTSCPATFVSLAGTGVDIGDITAGQSGALYIVGSTNLMELPSTCPQTNCTPSAVTTGVSGSFTHIASGDDGNIWAVTETATVHRVTPGGVVTAFTFTGFSPNWIAAASDGTLWFTDNADGKIGHFDPNACSSSCAVTSYNASHSPSGLNDVVVDASNNIWVAERSVNYLAEVACTPTCAIREYKYVLPGGGSVNNISALAIAPDGLLFAGDLSGVTDFVDLSTCSTSAGTCNVIYSGGSYTAYEATAAADGNMLWQSPGNGLVRMIMP